MYMNMRKLYYYYFFILFYKRMEAPGLLSAYITKIHIMNNTNSGSAGDS